METIKLELTVQEAKVLTNAWGLYGLAGLGAPPELLMLGLKSMERDFATQHEAIEGISAKLRPVLGSVQDR